jgi:hypothetical protein
MLSFSQARSPSVDAMKPSRLAAMLAKMATGRA